MNKPSEKAMQLALRYVNNHSYLNRKEKNELAVAWATEIDTHTAPYKKALDEAERALEFYASHFKLVEGKTFSRSNGKTDKFSDEWVMEETGLQVDAGDTARDALTTIRAIKGE